MNMNLSSLKRWKNSDILGGAYNDKNPIHMPRQVTKIVLKTFENQGFFQNST